MKKILSLILSIVLCFSFMISVNAQAPSATVKAFYSAEKDAMIASGTLTSERGNVTLVLKVSDADGTAIHSDQLTVAYDSAANGVYEYSFAPVQFDASLSSGLYDVVVSGMYLSQAVKTQYDYAGPDLLYNALKEVNSTIDNKGDFSTLSEATYTRLGVDYSLFDSLGDGENGNGKETFTSVMYTKDYPIPSVYSVEAIDDIKEQTALFASDYAQACLIGSLADVTDTSKISGWIDTHKDNFNTDIAETTDINEKTLFGYVQDICDESYFTDRFMARPQFLTVATLRDAMYEDALLAIIESRHYSESTVILQDFSSLFGIDESNIRSEVLANVYENMPGDYDNYSEVGEKFNELVNEYLNGRDSDSSSNSNGSSGGRVTSGRGGSASIVVSDENASAVTESAFADIDDVSWAVQAINYLADKGIVEGKTATAFAPNDLIKRSEFIKLVVTAFANDEIVGGECTFTDVATDAWYAPSVAAAQRKNLVFGDELNRFMPDAYITRQDMAVILYRAYEFYGDTNISLTYADKAKVSEYAREAVAVLSSAGIINGVGDNKFEPLSNATRAQAAQMIYKMMIK